MAKKRNIEPRNFYLNERHLFLPDSKSGGGGNPKLGEIDWENKTEVISSSIARVTRKIEKSDDPLKEDRYFVVAVPEDEVKKVSSDKKKAPDGTYGEKVEFSGAHGKVLERLGLDLIEVSNSGLAVVHADPNQFAQLKSRSLVLDDIGIREQARWVSINSFDTIPMQSRIDMQWFKSLSKNEPVDVVFELQPIINKLEANTVIEKISSYLSSVKEGLSAIGTDFSGRYWVRGKADRKSIKQIAKNFYSIQSIHHPLFSYGLAASSTSRASNKSDVNVATPKSSLELPCIAVVDTGTPKDHKYLADFRRGLFVPQGAVQRDNADHGSKVASRAVFGGCDSYDDLIDADGTCSYYDAVVGDAYEDRVDDKLVLTALAGVRGAAPDVRVFNLSFGSKEPLSKMSDTVFRERLLELQDLDNFAFSNDAVVVVAAGNSNRGVIPKNDYPNHFDDPLWALGAWACGYNTLVCGSQVSKLMPDGLGSQVGYPSPFSRVGFGLNDAPVPSFSDSGGNCNDSYQKFNGGGVYCFDRVGDGIDEVGTSLSAPIVAREAAFAIEELKKYCPTGSQPAAVLVRACLATFATRLLGSKDTTQLFDRTLGYGKPSHHRLFKPFSESAVVLWQGIVDSPRDLVGVRVPIPKKWLAEATNAELELTVCYDTPVNSAVVKSWACRKVNVRIRTADGERAVTGTNAGHRTYPLYKRKFNLTSIIKKHAPINDFWMMELSYDEIAPYPAGSTFDPRQKVGVVAELRDIGDNPVSPQKAVQDLPLSAEFNLLSANSVQSRTPVIIRNR